MQIKRGRSCRKGLGRGYPFTWYGTQWHRPFFNWPNRLPGDSIQDIDKSLFGNLCQSLDLPPIDSNVYQGWRCRWVIIPKLMVNNLVVPNTFPGLGIQSDDTGTEQIVTQPLSTIPIIARVTDRQIYVAQFRVCAQHGPDIGCACYFPRIVLPSIVTELTFLGYGMEYPFLLTSVQIKSTHMPWR